MGTPTGTKVILSEFSGKYKLLIITATVESASDTITLTEATHGITAIAKVICQVTGGMDSAFQAVQITYSGLVITLTSTENDGTASTAWTTTTVELWVIGY